MRAPTICLIASSAAIALTPVATAQPCDPPMVNTLDTPGFAFDLAIEGDLLYIADAQSGLSVYTLAAPGSPTAPVFLGSVDLGQLAHDVKVHGNMALVTNTSESAFFIDVSDPSAPVSVLEFSWVGFTKVDIGANVAVLQSGGPNLFVFDLSDPRNPTNVGNIFGPGGLSVQGVLIDGEVVYISWSNGMLRSYDLADPSRPVLLDELEDAGGATFASPMTIEGDRLYAMNTVTSEIRVVDVSDPSNLALLAAPTVDFAIRELSAVGNVVYAAAVDDFVIYDFNTLSPNPPILGLAAPPETVFYIEVRDGVAYLCANADVMIFDVAACPSPPIITTQPASVVAQEGGSPVEFQVAATFAESFQWRRDGAPIVDGADYAGTTSAVLTVQSSTATEGAFDVVVTNPQGSVASATAVLAVTGGGTCPGDLNGDDAVNVLDLLMVLSGWGVCQ